MGIEMNATTPPRDSRGLPGLASAIASTLAGWVKQRAADRFVRAALPYDWPVSSALKSLFEYLGSEAHVRLGLLEPFVDVSVAGLPPQRITVSRRAQEITEWRNEAARLAAAPAAAFCIVLGDADGPEEAGLKSVRHVVKQEDVLAHWADDVKKWLDGAVANEETKRAIDYLFELVGQSRVDPLGLDRLFDKMPRGPVRDDLAVMAALRKNLWQAGLLPDKHLLDKHKSRERLDINLSVMEFLRSFPDASREKRWLQQIEEKAAEGDAVAVALKQYRETSDSRHLRDVELEDALGLLEPEENDPRPKLRELDLYEFLDVQTDSLGSADKLQALEELGEDWELQDTEEDVRLEWRLPPGAAEVGDVVTVRVNQPSDGSIRKARRWAEGIAKDQCLYFVAGASDTADPLAWKPVAFHQVKTLLADREAERNGVAGLLHTLLERRRALGAAAPWLAWSPLEVLLLKPDVRRSVEGYLQTWGEVVDSLTKPESRGHQAIRRLGLLVAAMDAVWAERDGQGGSGTTEYVWCELGPLHPYVLVPNLAVANYVHNALRANGEAGQCVGADLVNLGSRAVWMQQQCSPAYRALWSPTTPPRTLYLVRPTLPITFALETQSRRSLPSADEGEGLRRVLEAFVGFHPYVRESMVITLVNPPHGRAVGYAVKQLMRLVSRLTVNIVATHDEVNWLSDYPDVVYQVDRVPSVSSLGDWAEKKNAASSHVTIYFDDFSAIGSIPKVSPGPAPGLHIALSVEWTYPESLTDIETVTPCVSFEPRQENQPVRAMQLLTGADDAGVFTVKQARMADSLANALVRLSERSEWLVIASPSPLGVMLPREPLPSLKLLGCDRVGPYELRVYARDMYPLSRMVERAFASGAPLSSDRAAIERMLSRLPLSSPNGLLKVGQSAKGPTPVHSDWRVLWEHLGLLAASHEVWGPTSGEVRQDAREGLGES